MDTPVRRRSQGSPQPLPLLGSHPRRHLSQKLSSLPTSPTSMSTTGMPARELQGRPSQEGRTGLPSRQPVDPGWRAGGPSRLCVERGGGYPRVDVSHNDDRIFPISRAPSRWHLSNRRLILIKS